MRSRTIQPIDLYDMFEKNDRKSGLKIRVESIRKEKKKMMMIIIIVQFNLNRTFERE